MTRTETLTIIWPRAAMVDPESVIARFVVEGEPVSKARARFTKRGSKVVSYTPEKTKTGERRMALAYRQSSIQKAPSATETYGVSAIFFNGTRQRRDVDNMLKLILDGLNGVAWADDTQVLEVSGRKEYVARDQARTEVLIYRLGPVSRLTKPCEECGEPFETWPSLESSTKFCSRACRTAFRNRRREVTCERCGVTFLAHGPARASAARFCSMECTSEARRVEMRCDHCGQLFTKQRCHVRKSNYCSSPCAAEASRQRRLVRPSKGKCERCGGPVSKVKYKTCRSCLSAAPGKPKVSGS